MDPQHSLGDVIYGTGNTKIVLKKVVTVLEVKPFRTPVQYSKLNWRADGSSLKKYVSSPPKSREHIHNWWRASMWSHFAILRMQKSVEIRLRKFYKSTATDSNSKLLPNQKISVLKGNIRFLPSTTVPSNSFFFVYFFWTTHFKFFTY